MNDTEEEKRIRLSLFEGKRDRLLLTIYENNFPIFVLNNNFKNKKCYTHHIINNLGCYYDNRFLFIHTGSEEDPKLVIDIDHEVVTENDIVKLYLKHGKSLPF